jgi:hypothetical protein
MAKIELNPIVTQLRGALGDVVFKQYGTKIVVSKRPDLSAHVPTPAQRAQRERFRLAMAYAKRAMADPLLKALYDERAAATGKPVLSVAVKDHMTAPTIDGIDLDGYGGEAGGEVVVLASDDFGVAEVRVTIGEEDGEGVIEQGAAVEVPAGSGRWVYEAQASAPPGARSRVAVQARDRPGNVTEECVVAN